MKIWLCNYFVKLVNFLEKNILGITEAKEYEDNLTAEDLRKDRDKLGETCDLAALVSRSLYVYAPGLSLKPTFKKENMRYTNDKSNTRTN